MDKPILTIKTVLAQPLFSKLEEVKDLRIQSFGLRAGLKRAGSIVPVQTKLKSMRRPQIHLINSQSLDYRRNHVADAAGYSAKDALNFVSDLRKTFSDHTPPKHKASLQGLNIMVESLVLQVGTLVAKYRLMNQHGNKKSRHILAMGQGKRAVTPEAAQLHSLLPFGTECIIKTIQETKKIIVCSTKDK